MNIAIYNERGLKVAGGEVMPQALPDQVFLQEMPCYAGGVLYFEQDNGFVGAVAMDESAARQAIDREPTLRQPSAEKLFKIALCGGLGQKDVSGLCRRLHIRFDERRSVICVLPESNVSPAMLGVLSEVFSSEDVMITEMSREEVAVVCSGVADAELAETAGAIRDTFINELNTDVHIGIGETAANIAGIGASRQTALQAASIGRRLSYKGGVWVYARLLPEMLLAGIETESVARHSALISRIRHTIDDETEELLDELFRQNLNISRTAKELFMHRNTLIYRLDKIRKSTGLDATSFDDAVTLRMILALARLNYEQ